MTSPRALDDVTTVTSINVFIVANMVIVVDMLAFVYLHASDASVARTLN
jgi:hypothetical protein